MAEKQRRYAEGTSVAASKSRAELEELLAKHGAGQRLVANDDDTGRVVVQFRLSERIVKLSFQVQRSKLNVHDGWCSGRPQGWHGWTVLRRTDYVDKLNAQAEREAWRRLLLVVKGKLELIADKFSTVEGEFLANIMLPNGSTVGEFMVPQLEETYRDGGMPKMLGMGDP